MRECVYVIIVNYNAYECTIQYIAQLRRQENVSVQCVVVDSGSQDGSGDRLEESVSTAGDVTVLRMAHNRGYAAGNNVGLRYLSKNVGGDPFVIISNTDIEIDNPHLIEELISCYRQCANVAFVAPVMYVNGREAVNCAWVLPSLTWDVGILLPGVKRMLRESVYYRFSRNDVAVRKVDCLPGSFMLGTLGRLEAIGYFDERTFLYGEERILAKKVKRAGLNNYLVRSLKYDHAPSATISKHASDIVKLKYVLRGREIYHGHYGDHPLAGYIVLKILHGVYLTAKRIQAYCDSVIAF